MLSKNKAKFIKSLHIKKYRTEYGLFIVEGEKNVLETLSSDYQVTEMYATDTFLNQYPRLVGDYHAVQVSEADLTGISAMESNTTVLALVKQKTFGPLKPEGKELVLVLEDVRDPGNLGTIFRIADWYGLSKIICSPTTAEMYNPKVIASSMGSFSRIQVWYTPLSEVIWEGHAVWGADLQGKNVHHYTFAPQGYLVMGNESKGLSVEAEALLTDKLTIPSYGDAESLNVGVATAVILDNWRRQLSVV